MISFIPTLLKKALLITYFFPPANSVASPRVQAFADNFVNYNIFPVVITRHWTGLENQWADFLKENNTPPSFSEEKNYSVFRFPYSNQSRKNYWAKTNKLFSKIYHFANPMLGHFSTEVNAYRSLNRFLTKHLESNKYDFILVSAPPFNLVRLGYELSLKFSIPLILDMRDIWQSLMSYEGSYHSPKQKYFLYLYKYYAKKWFAQARLIATVSKPLAREVELSTNKKAIVITNGFEENLFKELKSNKNEKLFNFTIVGTIYPNQNVSILIQGLKRFKKLNPTARFKLNFIGINTLPDIGSKLKAELADFEIYLTGKINRLEALQFLCDAHVLFYPGWKGHKGIYSTKIFEYLGAKRNIIIAPGDDDVIDELLNKTKSGIIANNPEDFALHLTKLYNEWESTGTVAYNGDEMAINYYTRENQTKIFAENILNVIG